MDLVSLKLTETETGFTLAFESADADIRGYWKAKVLDFVAGNCTCSCCADSGCECCCQTGEEDDD